MRGITRLLTLPNGLSSALFTNQHTFCQRRSYNSKQSRCEAHMNELPVPCGSWDVYYKKQQKFYGTTLKAGVSWFIFSLVMLIYTDCMFFNWGPPKRPTPPTDAREECGDD